MENDQQGDIIREGILSFKEVERMRNSIHNLLLSKDTCVMSGDSQSKSKQKQDINNGHVPSPYSQGELFETKTVPTWIKTSKDEIKGSTKWLEMKKEIMNRVGTAVENQVIIRQQISDEWLQNGKKRMTYGQKKKVKELQNLCVTTDEIFSNLSQQSEEMLSNNQTLRALTGQLPSQPIEAPKDSSDFTEVFAKHLASHPWGLIKQNMKQCLIHSFPSGVRKEIWSSALSDSDVKKLFKEFLVNRATRSGHFLPSNYYPLLESGIQRIINRTPSLLEHKETIFIPVMEFIMNRVKKPEILRELILISISSWGLWQYWCHSMEETRRIHCFLLRKRAHL